MNCLDLFSMKDKCTVVTGAAMGLGKAMAFALADAGSNIVVADMSVDMAEKAAEDIRKKGVEALAIETDITDPYKVEHMVEEVVRRFGKIDVLFNNAGIGRHAKAEDMPLQDWYDVMNVNLNGAFIVSQAVGRVMIRQNKGNIVNISSMSGLIVNTPQCQCAYNASKGGVIMLTKSLAVEWAPHNIRVNTIAPGYMKTELTRKYFEDTRYMDTVGKWMDFTPVRRAGVPEELGGIAIYLASEASSFVTGGVFVVDGGYTAY